MAVKYIKEQEPAPGTLGVPELYALAIGQVIGAGVITLIVPAIKMTGYSAWLAYLVAIIAGFIIILPNVFISSTLRLGGGYYSLLCDLVGPKAGGIFTFTYVTRCLSLSLFGVSAAAYIGDVIPALNTPVARIIIGVALLSFFYIVNLMGIDIMAKAQKLMTWLLIAALFLFAVFGIAQMKLPIFDTSDPNWLINGWGITFQNGKIAGGFTGAVLLFIYSCQGYSMTIAYGRNAKNSRIDIPKVLIMSVPTLIVLYVGVAMAATGCMSIEEYGDSTTLVFAAQKIFPTWLFYAFIIGGPIMALLSTLNSSFAYNAITLGQSCDDGWLPEAFGRKNKYGARKYILTAMFVIGLIPIIFAFSITTITNMVQLISSYYAILNYMAFINMPKKYPHSWAKAKMHVPNGVYYFPCTLSLAGLLVILWKSVLSISTTLAVVNIVMIVVLSILGVRRSKSADIVIHTSVWADEEDMKNITSTAD